MVPVEPVQRIDSLINLDLSSEYIMEYSPECPVIRVVEYLINSVWSSTMSSYDSIGRVFIQIFFPSSPSLSVCSQDFRYLTRLCIVYMFLFTSYISLSRELSWMLLPVARSISSSRLRICVSMTFRALDFSGCIAKCDQLFQAISPVHYHQYASRIISHIYSRINLTTIPKASDDILVW
jgi:hypothetical protein